MSVSANPTSMRRPKTWDEDVEEAYRFQLAGYRDEKDYVQTHGLEGSPDRWEHNGWIKKLKRKDGCFYYFNKTRECSDKDVHRTKIYIY